MNVFVGMLTVVGVSAASYRLTRLVTCDTFPPVRHVREWVSKRGPGWAGELVTCPWCAGGYVAAAVTAITDLYVSVPVPFLVGALAWTAAGMLGQHDTCD